ncbi:MAG TPA: ABC transporter permease [Pyrinomonadaceae bacterium]|nr:ABC transporter permease [Pyrinomonadaceae bacterium]
MLESFWRDLLYGARAFRKNPGFALVAALTLGLGIGANTAIFSVVEAVLLRPLPFAAQDRLMVLWKRDLTANQELVELSIPEFNDWRAQTDSFESLAAMPTSVYGYGYVLGDGGEPLQVESARVSADFFDVLGARPALGRAFTPEDDRPGAARVAVISQRLWRERFNSDPGLVGRTITLNQTGFEVVGVMPAGFEFPRGADIWSPLSANIGGGALQNRQAVFLQAVGRLKPGATREQAEAELNTIIGRVAAAHPETEAAGHRVVLTPLVEYVFGSARLALWMLLAATGLLLAVACANVANLLLARATARRREMAVRAALGAGRLRLARQLFAESLLLASAGGALGVALAYGLIDLLVAFAPADIPRMEGVGVSGVVLAFSLGVTLLTAFAFGLVPAVTASKVNLAETLGEGGKGSGGRKGNRLRAALVVAEVAVTCVLLVGAGLVLRSFVKLQQVDAGFDTENVLTFQLRLHGQRYPDREAVREFYRQLLERLEAQPGVLAAGAVLIRPLEGSIGWDVPYATEGQTPEEAKRNRVPNFEVVTPHYFRSVGLPLKAGREFTEADDEEAPKVAVVSEAMARAAFPAGANPVGRRIRLFDPSDSDTALHTVVGVVGDARYRDVRDARWDVYVPYRQFNFPVRYVTVRTASDPALFADVVRREVAALDPAQAVAALKTTSQLFSENVARPRFNTLLLALLSLLAALLAAVGIYGVMSYAVRQRTHEIGIRLALGAQPRDVLRMVVRQGMALALAGILGGLLAAAAATRLLSGLLYDVSAFDPLTFSSTALTLTFVALLASYLPARRATKVDPTEALRYE